MVEHFFEGFLSLLVESVSCAHGRVLAHGALNEDARDAHDEHAGEVGDEEGSPPHSQSWRG